MSMERPTNGESGEQKGKETSSRRQMPDQKRVPIVGAHSKSDVQEDPPARPSLPREYRRKVYFLRQAREKGATPATDEGKKLLENPKIIEKNKAAFDSGEMPEGQLIKTHLSAREADVFDTQKISSAITEALCKDTQDFDMVDLVLGMKMTQELLESHVTEKTSEAKIERLYQLKMGCFADLVHRIDPLNLHGISEFDLTTAYEKLFSSDEPLDIAERQDILVVESAINERIAIAHLVMEGSLQSSGHPFSDSAYSKASSSDELDQLNHNAAETIERLHLLKAYGVIPFEVSGDRMQLPWDIAIEPPLQTDLHGNISPHYAEGAIADFLLLPSDPERDDVSFHLHEDAENLRKVLSVGNSQTLLRLRLHDNGQISGGNILYNVPSDHTEEAFAERNAHESFQRIRGLLIALAYDALVHDDVAPGETVQKSVANSQLRDTSVPAGKHITELLLRRRKALRSARINQDNRRPEGWTLPSHDVQGYIRKLPEGARRRPTAEAEAQAYYESKHIPFVGLAEGETFVNPYTQGSEDRSVVYRRARFRPNSATAQFLKGV